MSGRRRDAPPPPLAARAAGHAGLRQCLAQLVARLRAAEDLDEELVNGEDVRAALHAFARAHVAQTAVAALGFAMAVVGLWGDGVGTEAVLIQI